MESRTGAGETYALPDAALLEEGPVVSRFLVWQPAEPLAVIGRGNRMEESLRLDRLAADGIRICQRPTGGEAVLLTPRMLALSAVLFPLAIHPSRYYFSRFNQAVCRALTGLGVCGVRERGISDLALGEKKIMGSSMYRNRKLVFYHAILNVAEDPGLLERYLLHPRREPDYRRQRSHRDFVTSLEQAGHPANPGWYQPGLCAALAACLPELSGELPAAPDGHPDDGI